MQKFLSVRILCFKKIVADVRNLKHDSTKLRPQNYNGASSVVILTSQNNFYLLLWEKRVARFVCGVTYI